MSTQEPGLTLGVAAPTDHDDDEVIEVKTPMLQIRYVENGRLQEVEEELQERIVRNLLREIEIANKPPEAKRVAERPKTARRKRAKYDGFMPEDMRPQVGMELNVPLARGRRAAAVREASERLNQRRAEYQGRLDQVRLEVQSAISRATQSQQAIRLYAEKILPATKRSAESAQSNYTSGTLDFLRLIDAERQVYAQQAMYFQAIAEYHRRLAELERAVGGSLPMPPE